MEYKNGENRIYAVNDEGVEVGEVTFVPTGEDMFIIDHTGVDDAAQNRRKENCSALSICESFAKKPEYQEVQAFSLLDICFVSVYL
ncbi:Uncharacterized protein yjdJ [Listeria monocytogenes]|nr:Uncharacterized protein yjdJ [Listeria monocytogenes]